ncbi:MAG: hypothetical protein IT289_01590 [Oligoflexia bacterium]|nr:hypothetical protein [Oligoflexia bacterium]
MKIIFDNQTICKFLKNQRSYFFKFNTVWHIALVITLGLTKIPFALGVECAGPVRADINVIYLHGLDTHPSSKEYEATNRKLLTELAQKSKDPKFRIAFPRAQMSCPNDRSLRCWPLGDMATIKLEHDRLIDETRVCWPNSTAPKMFVGFSRGGMFVSALSESCVADADSRLVIVGAGAQDYPHAPSKACNPVEVYYGTFDTWGSVRARSLYKTLQNKVPGSTITSYEGGHIFTEDLIRKLSTWPNPRSQATDNARGATSKIR